MAPYDTPCPPYIGITDFMSAEQSLAMLKLFSVIIDGKIPHKLMIGVMMSYKTLHGLDTKWTPAFPLKERVSGVFVRHPKAFNTLHYADYTNTDVFDSLTRAISYGGINIDAIQLDMIWPDPDEVANAVHSSRKAISVILQVGTNAIADAGETPQAVVDRLEPYDGIIDGVLLDKSAGTGTAMNAETLLPFIEAIYQQKPWLKIAVAGGLGPATMHLAEPIIAQYPGMSIDAQGRLRPSGSALDPIDWSLAETYLMNAVSVFRRYRSA